MRREGSIPDYADDFSFHESIYGSTTWIDDVMRMASRAFAIIAKIDSFNGPGLRAARRVCAVPSEPGCRGWEEQRPPLLI